MSSISRFIGDVRWVVLGRTHEQMIAAALGVAAVLICACPLPRAEGGEIGGRSDGADQCGEVFYADAGDSYADDRPVWSNDGNVIYWSTDVAPGVGQPKQLVRKALDSSQPETAFDAVVRASTVGGVTFKHPCAASPVATGLVLFAGEENGQEGLYIWDEQAGEDTLVISAAMAGLADWTFLDGPTGPVERIVFHARLQSGDPVDIYAVDPDGGNLVNLTADFESDAWNPAVSPDGSRIAFASDALDAVWVMNADGSAKRAVPEAPSGWLRWYDDHAIIHVAFLQTCYAEYRYMNVDAPDDLHNGMVILPSGFMGNNNPKAFYISPDGQTLVLAADAGCSAPTMDIYLADVACLFAEAELDPDACGEVFYADEGDSYADDLPVWSVDGSIIYWSTDVFPGVGQPKQIVRKALDSSQPETAFDAVVRQNTVGDVSFRHLSDVSPTVLGLVLFAGEENGQQGLYIWDEQAEGDTLVISAAEVSVADWTFLDGPTGPVERIVFHARLQPTDPIDIYAVDPDGANLVSLTADFEPDAWNPAVSPDGSRIAFACDDVDPVWVMNADGSDKHAVTGVPGGRMRWYSDQAIIHVAFLQTCYAEYRYMNVDDPDDPLNGTVVLPSGFMGDKNPKAFDISPDGQTLVLAADAGCWAPTMDIYLADLPCLLFEDCNVNGVPDDQDIADGTSLDCNSNGVPDECDLSSGVSEDCNTNGIPDECDIADGTSEDCTGNGIPDTCEADCNGDGTADVCQVADGTSPDCNANGIPDECDVADGTSSDENGNGVPDECETDCNWNGTDDPDDIASGFSLDCNENGVPDECEIYVNSTAPGGPFFLRRRL